MTDETNAAPILSGDDKAKIKEWYGIDVDSDVLSPMVDYIFKRIPTFFQRRSERKMSADVNVWLSYEI